MSDALTGKVVVITGGAGGIGRALARSFASRGARIALLDRDAEALEAALTSDWLAVACDVTQADQCASAIAQVRDALGGIDVLVNNAGISHRSAFSQTDATVLRTVMDVNFFGAVHCTQAALPDLVRSRGRIVAVSSVAGFAPLIGRTGYAASKHALHGFFDSLRAELAHAGVSVTIACPYFTDTALRTHALDGSGNANSAPPPSMGRPLTPEEVAEDIVTACLARRRMVISGRVGRASWWVSRLAPRAYELLMRRSQRGEGATS